MKLTYEMTSPPEGGAKDLPPIIYLHGGLDSRKSWRNVASDIAKLTGRKAYALDLRNHGESQWSDEMDFETLANDVEEFLNDHGISKAVLVGHSMGGRTAIILALKKPEKVEKLVVEDMGMDPYGPIETKSILTLLKLVKNSLEAIPSGADEVTAKNAVLDRIKSVLPETVSKKGSIHDLDTIPLKKAGNTYNWQANLDVLEETIRSNKPQNYTGTYGAKALFLYGTKSFFEVDKDKTVDKHFPRAIKIAFEGAGHLLHHDYPERFIKEVATFINE